MPTERMASFEEPNVSFHRPLPFAGYDDVIRGCGASWLCVHPCCYQCPYPHPCPLLLSSFVIIVVLFLSLCVPTWPRVATHARHYLTPAIPYARKKRLVDPGDDPSLIEKSRKRSNKKEKHNSTSTATSAATSSSSKAKAWKPPTTKVELERSEAICSRSC